MKKFLIFLVSTIVAVCIGMTFYQFAKNDEVIKVTNQTLYINYGDKLTLDDIGFSRKEADKNTEINFNAGGDEVTSIIKYDDVSKCYVPTQKGGATTIKISTTNRKYKTLTIDVVVGIGTEENPYYVSNEQQLFNIGNVYGLDAHFELVNDIELTESHLPIGLISGSYNEFVGNFNGGYHTISNLNIEECDNAGLFAIMGANSSVYNLNLSNSVFNGSFLNVGTVAGICYGNINKVVVENSTITNTRASSNTGAVVGKLLTDKTNSYIAGMVRTYAYTDQNNLITAAGKLGGLAGVVDSAYVHACHTNLCLKNTSTGVTGGLVGDLSVDKNTYIRESYSITEIQANGPAGNIAGIISASAGANMQQVNNQLVLVGLYYNETLNNVGAVGSDALKLASATTFAISGKTDDELKTKKTYIYYINSASEIIYWDKVWSLVDGEYPTLTFINKFEDIKLEADSSTSSPENPSNPDENPTNPDIGNGNADPSKVQIISNKQDLVTAFQTGKDVSGDYIINNDIDLGGMVWAPVNFSGSLKSDAPNIYTISNFVIDNNGQYVGFFSNLASAKISNIKFANITVKPNDENNIVGLVTAFISGNTILNNVSVTNATVDSKAVYVGGLVGYINQSIANISDCSVEDLTTSNQPLNVGGLVGYVGNNTTITKCSVTGNTTVVAADRAGGIASVNYGKIDNSSASGTINSVATASSAGYFGGLIGVNYGLVELSNSLMEMSIFNNSDPAQSIFYYVGGLCGYNVGTFNYCSATANQITGNNSLSAIHLAGLAGCNKGTIKYCLADIVNLGETRANTYSAGLASYNFGGTIMGCWAEIQNLQGYQVAGLVRVNNNNGTVDCCGAGSVGASRSTYTGVQIASFTYEISSGTISNCVVMADLNCSYDTGWMAGFAGFMPCTNNRFGTISNSIANVSFNGKGDMYLDLAQDGLMKKERTTGTITNCVISKDADVEGVIVSEYDNSFLFWGTAEAGSKSNYIVADAAEITDIETYLDVQTCNFDIAAGELDSKWIYFDSTRIPLPRSVNEVMQYFGK